MSVGDAKATIRQGIQATTEGQRMLESVAADAADATGLARHTTHDSKHAEVEKGLVCLKDAAHKMELTARRLEASVEAAGEYLTALG